MQEHIGISILTFRQCSLSLHPGRKKKSPGKHDHLQRNSQVLVENSFFFLKIFKNFNILGIIYILYIVNIIYSLLLLIL